jgi:hypothetical protein
MDQSPYRVEVDRINSDEWSNALDLFEDANLYQTWPYGAVRWGERNLSHIVLKHGDQTVAMAQVLVVRPLPIKVGLAHVRWGPLCHRKGERLEPEAVRAIAAALCKEYVTRRGLFLRVLANGSMDSARGLVFRQAFAQYAEEAFGSGESYRTFVVDLHPPLDIIRKQLDQKWRNQLNRAERNGLTVIDADEIEGFRIFASLYQEMLARKQFASSDVGEFERVQRALPPRHRMKVFVCEEQGVPVAVLVASALGDTGIYLLGATNEQGMKSKGAYLLQWHMIQWLKGNGFTCYDLGGINPETNPGVYHFKSGLSGADVLYLRPWIACSSVGSRAFAGTVGLARSSVRTARRLFHARM